MGRWMKGGEEHRVGMGIGSLKQLMPRVRVSPLWVRMGSPEEATMRMREEIDRVVSAVSAVG
jgi:hypothetical protein